MFNVKGCIGRMVLGEFISSRVPEFTSWHAILTIQTAIIAI
jgi:hypothetical protein